MEHWNQQIFLLVNQHAGSNVYFDWMMIAFAEYLPIVFAVVLIWLGFFNKKRSAFDRDERRQAAFFAGYTMVVGLLINYLITLIYFHPRPFMDHLGTALIVHVPDSSMPSDHTTLMVSVAFGLLLFGLTRKIGVVLLILGVLGGAARVYCGVHYPFDILASVAVSLFAATLGYCFKKYLMNLSGSLFGVLDRILK